MKIINELVAHFWHTGELTKRDLETLKAHGFSDAVERFLNPVWEEEPYCYEPEIEEDFWYREIDILDNKTNQSLSEGIEQAKKSKSKKAKPEYLSLEAFCKQILAKIEIRDNEFSRIFEIAFGKKTSAEYWAILSQPIDWEREKIGDKLWHQISRGTFDEWTIKVLFDQDFWQKFLFYTKKLSPRHRKEVIAWASSEQPLDADHEKSAIWWVRQVRQLQTGLLRTLHQIYTGQYHRANHADCTDVLVKHHLLFVYMDSILNQNVKENTQLSCFCSNLPIVEIIETLSVLEYHFPKALSVFDEYLNRKDNMQSFFAIEQGIGLLYGIQYPEWLRTIEQKTKHNYLLEHRPLIIKDEDFVIKQAAFVHIGYMSDWTNNDSSTWYMYDFPITAKKYIEDIQPFSAGYALVKHSTDGYYFIDKNGLPFLKGKYQKVLSFSDGMAAVLPNEDRGWGFVNTKGEEIIRDGLSHITGLFNGFTRCVPFSEGFGFVYGVSEDLEFVWHIVDKQGNYKAIPEACYENSVVYPFSEGLAYIEHLGFVNTEGEILIRAEGLFDKAYSFREGRAWVKKNGLRGYINNTGKLVVPCQYDKVGSFSESVAVVSKDKKWGLIDLDGNEVVPPQYSLVAHCSEGMCGYAENGKWGFINKWGQVVIPAIYNHIQAFQNGKSLMDNILMDKMGQRILYEPGGNRLQFKYSQDYVDRLLTMDGRLYSIKLNCLVINDTCFSVRGFATNMNAFELNNEYGICDNDLIPYTLKPNEWMSEGYFVRENEEDSRKMIAFNLPYQSELNFTDINSRVFILPLKKNIAEQPFCFENKIFKKYVFLESEKTLKLCYKINRFLTLDWEATLKNAQKREANTPQ